MLESAVVQQNLKRKRKKFLNTLNKELLFRFKRILEFKGTDHFDVLPNGWIEVTHYSGLPVYLVIIFNLF